MVLPKHILETFDEALSDLRKNLLTMAGLAERSLHRAINGLLQRDDSLCTNAIDDDQEVDQLEKQIDKASIEIFVRFQPVASDLRHVTSAIKLSSNIERIADEATNIAERAHKLNQHPPLVEVNLIVPIQAHATSMFKDSINAFVTRRCRASAGGRQPGQATRQHEWVCKPAVDRTDVAGPLPTARLPEPDLNLALSRTRRRSRD